MTNRPTEKKSFVSIPRGPASTAKDGAAQDADHNPKAPHRAAEEAKDAQASASASPSAPMLTSAPSQTDASSRANASTGTTASPAKTAVFSANDGSRKAEASLEDDAPSDEFFAAHNAAADGAPTVIRKRKRKKKKSKAPRRILIAVVALIVVVGGAALAANYFINSGKSSFQDAYENVSVDAVDEAVTTNNGKTVEYGGHTYTLNENIVSVLTIGFDRTTVAEEGEPTGQADALMLMAFDTQTGEAHAVGIPRDSIVAVDTYDNGVYSGQQNMQICLAFNYGDGRETSCENTVKAASRTLFNMPIQYYFALDENGLPVLNDAIGGVSLTALQSIPGTNVVEGQKTVLFGNSALRYVQYRDTSDLNSAMDRQARQAQYVSAFLSQALSQAQGSLGTLVDLFNVTNAYSVTNLGIDQFSYLATSVLQSGVTDVSVDTLPGEVAQNGTYAEFHLDETGVYETVLDVFYTQVD